MSALVGVTGATGFLGGHVAAVLSADGLPLRLLVRDPARAPDLDGAEVAPLTYGDAATESSLIGVEVLLLVSGHESPTRVAEHAAVIDAAARAGVRHVVYTSFAEASAEATFTLARDHAATETHLRASGMAWTFLRDNLYLDFFVDLAAAGEIRGPAGAGRVAAVARRDVVAAAAAVLRDPATHAGATYTLTGPEALSLAEIADVLTRAGREVTFHDETREQAYASRASYGAPDWQVEAWVSTYTAIAAGELAEVTDDVRRLTGYEATGLAALLGTDPGADASNL